MLYTIVTLKCLEHNVIGRLCSHGYNSRTFATDEDYEDESSYGRGVNWMLVLMFVKKDVVMVAIYRYLFLTRKRLLCRLKAF